MSTTFGNHFTERAMRFSERFLSLFRNPETPTYVLRDAAMEEDAEMRSVYVVTGSTGEYSDRRSWSVAAFLDRAQAECLLKKLDDWLNSNNFSPENVSQSTYDDRNTPCPYDPQFQCDYTGTNYTIVEIPLRLEEASGE